MTTDDAYTSSIPYRIDTHAHMLPPTYHAACLAHGHANPDGMPALPTWTLESHLALMDALSIRKSILSISSPGTHLVPGDDALAATVARECNAYASDLKRRHPERFGYFAALPIPAVEVCLEEVRRGVEEEDCDGFVMITNGHGVYPGDTALEPLFEELNRRKAVVFFHPTTPMCPCGSGLGGPLKAAPLASQYPNPMMEFFFETARVVTHLFMSGTMARCPDIKWILPHLGGAFPPLLSRVTGFSTLVPGPWTGVSEEEVREVFVRRVWFDLAGLPFPGQVRGLMAAGVGPEKLLYGSDYPFMSEDGVKMLTGKMEEGIREVFGWAEMENLHHRNAEKLIGA